MIQAFAVLFKSLEFPFISFSVVFNNTSPCSLMDSQRSFVAPDFQSSSCVTGHTSGFSYCLGFLKNGVSSFFFLRSHYTLHQDSQSIWLRGLWEPPSCWEITQTETENMCQTETVEVIFVIFHRFKYMSVSIHIYISVSIRIYIHILFLFFIYTQKRTKKMSNHDSMTHAQCWVWQI